MKIFFSVGEPSGDLHGANLIRQLRSRRPEIECVGYGGPKMAAAGCKLHEDLTQLAVMWLLRVILNLHTFWALYRRADKYLQDQRPDAVVLIDYPGFNWWIARCAKKHGIPVFYYGVPQMWAWAGWRVAKMRRLVDHVLCKLPFERDWFRQHGCEATYVGHPYFDEVSGRKLDLEFIRVARGQNPLIAILPGSRTQEVTNNLPSFLQAAERIHAAVPESHFAIAAFNEPQAKIAQQLLEKSPLRIPIHVGRTPELIEAAHSCLACSGSVSLELLYHQKPTVILYRITRLAHFVQGFFRKVPYITLVNLLATENLFGERRVDQPMAEPAEMLFPEFLTWEDRTEAMSHPIIRWLRDPPEHESRISQLAQLKSNFAHPGASARAADYILNVLGDSQRGHRIPPPHFRLSDAA